MDRDQQIAQSLKENSPGSQEITIMIMGSIGRIRSFTVSRRILLWSCLFLFFYTLISLFIINRYVNIRSLYRIQADRLKDVEEKYDGMEKDLLKAQQHAANLELFFKNTEQKGTGGAIQDEGRTASAMDRSGSNAPGVGNEKTSKSVDIEDLNIRRADSGIVVDFKLVNMDSGERAVEGYMHILVSDKNNNFPSVWNAPSKGIKNGLPSEYRSGEHFVIQRFKQYHREFISDNSTEMPASISILAYDTSGNLIIKRVYEVNNVS